MAKKIIIVGGVAGGATTAARLRRLDEQSNIIIIERGKYVSYANCGLPYYIGGQIVAKESLLLQTPQSLKARYNLDVRVENEAVKIDRAAKTLSVKDLTTGVEYKEEYDNLVLASGSEPVKPPIPGIDTAHNLLTIRSVEDADAIKIFIEKKQVKKAVVIGAGFIGLEITENLMHLGIDTTVVEMLDQVMGPMDKEMAALLEAHLKEKGVNLILNNGVKSFQENGKFVELNDGTKVEAELIVFAIGVKPENKLAKDAGLEIAERGGVVVDKHMLTSDASIYAIGDMVQVIDRVSGANVQIPLAWPANRQGRIVADNICGKNATYKGTLGAAIFKCFDLTAAMTGNNEKIVAKSGKPFQTIHIHPGSHAGYYPGSSNIALKIIYNPEDGKILGAQGVGRAGVDKRLDVISTAMQSGLKVWDLQDLELAYAPPYSSAKDPVNMLGYVADDIKNGLIKIKQWHEVGADKDIQTLDIREEAEKVLGEIPGSINIPLDQLRDRLAELSKEKQYLTYCQVGLRGYIAARLLMESGYKVYNLDGGFKTWAAVNLKHDSLSEYISESGIVEKLNTEGIAEAQTSIKSNYSGEIKNMKTIELNACGLQCPGPLLKVFEAMKELQTGDRIAATATDPAFPLDIKSWAMQTGNVVVESGQDENGNYKVIVEKGQGKTVAVVNKEAITVTETKDSLSMIVFDGDLDKALAAFIIANGALAFGKKVTILFTFWGLNVLRKDSYVPVKKTFLEAMFGWMMPRGANKLPLSKMNMAGMGPEMIKYIMKTKNVDSLPSLMKSAQDKGAHLLACTMSMDIMGIKKEELIDGIELAGVATYLGTASESKINLFV